jgi:hypothetical protein
MGVKVIKRIMWNKFVQVMLPAIITSNPWATYVLFNAPYSEKVSFLNTCYHWFHTLFTGISKKIKRGKKMKHMDLCGERIQQYCLLHIGFMR